MKATLLQMSALLLAGGCVVAFPDDGLHTEAGAAVEQLLRDADPGSDIGPRDSALRDAGAESCPEVCTNGCEGNVCRLACNDGCTCPAGQRCVIACAAGKCKGAIDCTRGDGCEIKCEVTACKKQIRCGSAPCDITCYFGACNATIDCSEASGCCVRCGLFACKEVRCPERCGNKCRVSTLEPSCDC